MTAVFVGTVSVPDFTRTRVTSDSDMIQPLPFLDGRSVTWNMLSTVPAPLTTTSFAALLAGASAPGAPYTIATRMLITVTGTTQVATFVGVEEFRPRARLAFNYFLPGQSVPQLTKIYLPTLQSSPAFQPDTFIYTTVNEPASDVTNNQFTNTIPVSVLIAVTSSARSPTTNFRVATTIEVTLTLTCSSGSALFGDVCTAFCTLPDNRDRCYPLYSQQCFGTPATALIGSTSTSGQRCRDFLRTFTAVRGPQADLDTRLDGYCQGKYSGFSALYNTVTASGTPIVDTPQAEVDQDICGCHMQSAQYDAYQAQLDQQLMGLERLAGNKYCLFQPCAASSFKRVAVGGNQCATPMCLDLAVVTYSPQGAINSPLKINQGADAKCEGVALTASPGGSTVTIGGGSTSTAAPGATTAAPPGSTTSATTSFGFGSLPIGVILGIGLLLLLVIGILIFFATRPRR